MKRIHYILVGALCAWVLAACDLQPRIAAFPGSVGDFISNRYPALLADPESEPEIYNSAASDYGVYASPELYGSVASADYILYADINDYMLPADDAPMSRVVEHVDDARPDVQQVSVAAPSDDKTESVAVEQNVAEPEHVADAPGDTLVVPMYGSAAQTHEITVRAGDTLYAIGKKYGATPNEIMVMNNMSPTTALRAGQRLRVPGNGDVDVAPKTPVVTAPSVVAPSSTVETPKASSPAPTPARVQLQDVTVAPGDTLYSISRAYSVPVNDLAVMNDLAAPFKLTVGQKIKVPNLRAAAKASVANGPEQSGAAVRTSASAGSVTPAANKSGAAKTTTTGAKAANATAKKDTTPASQPKKKISSDPKKKLPALPARSSSKFSWPVRGRVLSGFGTKPNGLVNDGINISAARGTAVVAAENGVVAYAGNEVRGMGNLVILQHRDGWMTVYAHLNSMAVRRGARVSVGQKIGTVGATGKVDKPQLHFEIRKGTKAYDPAKYLKK